jgi:hypothetical protein
VLCSLSLRAGLFYHGREKGFCRIDFTAPDCEETHAFRIAALERRRGAGAGVAQW